MNKIVIVGFLLLAAGCAATNKSKTEVVAPVFSGGKWIITELMEMPVDPGKAGKELPFFDFDTSSHQLSVYAGCNRMSGGFSIQSDTLILQQMISTRMACPDMDYENALQRLLLPGSYAFLEQQNTLLLFHNGSKVISFARP